MNIKTTSIEKAIQHTSSYHNMLQELMVYKKIYEPLDSIAQKYSQLLRGIELRSIRLLAKKGILSIKKSDGQVLYSLYSLAKYLRSLEIFQNAYYDITEAVTELGYKDKIKRIYPYMFREKLLHLHSHGHLAIIKLNHKITKGEVFISKAEVERFKRENISYVEAAQEAGVILRTFIQYWMGNYTKEVIKLSPGYSSCMYLKRVDWETFLKEKKKTAYLTKEQLAKRLKITAESVDKIAEEFNLSPLKEENSVITYFKKEDLESLITKQDELWKEIRSNYLTVTEATSLLGIANRTIHDESYKRKIHSIFVPPLIRTVRDGLNFRNGRTLIFLKEDILLLKEKREKEKDIERIIYQSEANSFQILKTALKEVNVQFSEKGKLTEEYWFNYVKKKTSKSKSSSSTTKIEIRVLFNTTIFLVELTNSREIFQYTDKELNLAVFNTNINKTIQLEIYKLLRKISQIKLDLNINYKFSSLNNVYKEKATFENVKAIYSIEQYIELMDFSKDIQRHKKRAIEDIMLQIENSEHQHRESAWLYILLHLNNAWRHYDVTLFPRISLSNLRIEGMEPIEALKWVQKNTLNPLEVKTVINQVKAMPFIHSKTKKKRYFFCSEELSEALSTALVLCELRCRICNPFAEMIIDFGNDNRLFKGAQQKAFFKGYDSNFTFKSKQMNRTLISYVYSVIKKITNRNPLEITKFIRSHVDEETTNIYIDIPQEQLDFITKQLFVLGNFGYAYDTLSNMLSEHKTDDRTERTKKALIVKEVFGDIYQIEQISSYLKRLSEEQKIVDLVIEDFSHDEKVKLINSIRLGQQPAKKDGFQCIYRTCRFPERNCEKCPFVVPNFYALSQLEEDFYIALGEFKKKFNSTTKHGEKVRLSNLLYSYLYLISIAAKTFGKETISSFFKNDLTAIKSELSLLPSAKEYVTIPKLK